jgi:hypothetical protein
LDIIIKTLLSLLVPVLRARFHIEGRERYSRRLINWKDRRHIFIFKEIYIQYELRPGPRLSASCGALAGRRAYFQIKRALLPSAFPGDPGMFTIYSFTS